MRGDESQILNVLTAFADAWIGGKTDAILACWDPESKDATYMAVERNEIIHGHAGLREYYEEVFKKMGYTVSRGELLDPTIRFMDEHCAHVICVYRWTYRVGSYEGTTDSRVSVVVRKRGRGWYFQHMHESIKWTAPASHA
jgi:hypothetical protein